MEIQRADPQRRRQAIVVLALVAVIGAGAIIALQNWFTELQHLPAENASELKHSLFTALAWSTGTGCFAVLTLALHMWRIGTRTKATMQFPPPGTRVVRDTVVLRGPAAARRATLLHLLSVVLLLSVVCLLVATWRLQSLFIAHAA